MSEEFDIKYKIWLEKDAKNILGQGGAKLLEAIKETKNLGEAAKKLGYSYKYAWNILQKIKKRFDKEVVRVFKGGKGGGGGVELTDLGEKLLLYYRTFEEYLDATLISPQRWQSRGLNISTTNILKGRVQSIEKDDLAAVVKIQVPNPVQITCVITSGSKKRLNLAVGKPIKVMFKAPSVTMTKEGMF